MTDLFTVIGNFGFPIAITTYLLVRFEKKLEALTTVIQQNNQITKDLVKAVESSNKGIRISNRQNERT